MLDRCCDGQVLSVERFYQPILHSRHGEFPSPQLIFELRPDFGRFEQREAVAVRGVADHDVTALFAKMVGEPLNLVHAVRFVIHRHDKS